MHLVVTGGMGFIGTHVVEAAAARGHQVTVIDRRGVAEAAAAPDCTDIPDLLQRSEATVVHGDLREPGLVAGPLPGCDAVIHLAARVGLGEGVADAPAYVADNDLATAVLLREMARAGIGRLVLASSMVVYGAGLGECPRDGAVPPLERTSDRLVSGEFEASCPRCGAALRPMLVDEDCPLAPANVYAATKIAQEHLAAAWARSTSGSLAALRFHNVFGRRLPADTPYAGVAALFLSALRRGRPPTVYEDGGQRRDFVHVRDVARAVVLAAERTGHPGHARPYNIGSGQPRTVLEMATALARVSGGPEPTVTGEFRLGDVRHITATNRRAIAELNWLPREAFEKGLAELAEFRP